VASKLCLLNTAKKEISDGAEIGGLFEHYEALNGIELHETQKKAIIMAVSSGVSVITGGPGTGKTTIVRAILYINEAQGITTQLLAPTGRAAKRLEETADASASTIHRALDIDYKGGRGVFTYDDPENIIRADVVIVDEVSMCDIILMNQLLQKIMRGTRIIFIGDIDQLPSVGAGNVLGDIIGSEVLPVVRLTEVYRQTELSKIVTNAHAINNGNMPDISNKSNDFFFETANNPAAIKTKVISLVTERLPKFIGAPSTRIQVLCPMKAGEAGMNSLNLALQEALNPSGLNKPEYEYGQTVFRLGDRVMQVVNNYNQEWTKLGETGTGVFNGDIGIINAVNRQNGEVTVEFEDGRTSIYTRSDLANLVLSYAITVHKSQGCEFDAVVIPVTSGAYMILTRNLLYTAVTRARQLVMLVGSVENIQKMVENTYTKQRFTMLKEFLKETSKRVKVIFQNVPDGQTAVEAIREKNPASPIDIA
jgi:exodeoxyribonuclease V alpha subunit